MFNEKNLKEDKILIKKILFASVVLTQKGVFNKNSFNHFELKAFEKNNLIYPKKRNITPRGEELVRKLKKIIIDYLHHYHIYKYSNVELFSFAYEDFFSYPLFKSWKNYLEKDWIDLREVIFKVKKINPLFIPFFDYFLEQNNFYFSLPKTVIKKKIKVPDKNKEIKQLLLNDTEYITKLMQKATIVNERVSKKRIFIEEEWASSFEKILPDTLFKASDFWKTF